MFDSFAEEILEAKVTTRAEHMKNCKAIAVVTGIKEEKTRNGPLAVIDLLLVNVTPRDPANTNVVGEKVGRTFPLYGSVNKKSYFISQLKRDMCHMADVDFKKVSAPEWAAVSKAASAGAFTGMLVELDPYDYETQGEKRVGHNFTKVTGKNTPADVAKRAALLAKGETEPKAFL